MPTSSDHELLRLLYRSLDFNKLYSLAPDVQREEIDALFGRLSDSLAEEPPEPSGEDAQAEAQPDVCVHIDGASRGNPGAAAAGVVIYDTKGNLVVEFGKYLGRATNNVAEYNALILAAEKLVKLKAERAVFHADSELLVHQINGRYKIRNAGLKPLAAKAHRLLAKIPNWRIEHVGREHNKRADEMANQALDEQGPLAQ